MMIKWMRNDGKNRGEIMMRNDGKMKLKQGEMMVRIMMKWRQNDGGNRGGMMVR